jgi:hypothetical protein
MMASATASATASNINMRKVFEIFQAIKRG